MNHVRSRRSLFVFVFLLLRMAVGPVQAIEQGLAYQGKLTDPAGQPIDGPVRMVFRLWYEPQNIMAWIETQSVVNVESGLFSVRVGAVIPIPTNLFYPNDSMSLGIQVGSDGELHPRIPLYHVPFAYGARRAWYAYDALRADTADRATVAGSAEEELWTPSGAHSYRGSANVGIGTDTPSERLHVRQPSGAVKAKIESGTGDADLVVDAGGVNNPTVEFHRNGVYAGGVGFDSSRTNMFIYHDGTVVFKNGMVGIGTFTPTNSLEVHGDVRATGVARGTFPRPNFDSGWQTHTPGQSINWIHNLGGSVDNYVVDMQARNSGGDPNNRGAGSIEYLSGATRLYKGYYYSGLNTGTITITRSPDDNYNDQIRVRIWRYN